jgi:hypothetical protein
MYELWNTWQILPKASADVSKGSTVSAEINLLCIRDVDRYTVRHYYTARRKRELSPYHRNIFNSNYTWASPF